MAQLRDAITSELIFEGDPVAVAIMAEQIGVENVLFDGVGSSFDHQEIIDRHEQEITNLQSVLEEPAIEPKLKTATEETLQNLTTRQPDPKAVEETKANLDEARKGVEEE